MKSLKTYNMDHDCIKILARESNKSRYVCRAIRRLSHDLDEVYASDFDMKTLMIALKEKEGLPPHIKRELINYLFESL